MSSVLRLSNIFSKRWVSFAWKNFPPVVFAMFSSMTLSMSARSFSHFSSKKYWRFPSLSRYERIVPDDSPMPIVYMAVLWSWRYCAEVMGLIPIFARPSVMSMTVLFLDSLFTSLSAARSASPIFVPESHGSCCLMVSVVIFCMILMIADLSYERGESVNAFPAKITSPNWLLLSCSRKEMSTFFAHSRRLGEISSASMDFEISRTRVMLLFE